MIDEKTVKGLKEKFSNVHPMIFLRSLERSKTGGELFDILSKIPKNYPIIWCEEEKLWKHTKDIFQAKNFKEE